MTPSPDPLVVKHNTQANRFEIEKDGLLAELEYRIEGGRIVFTHTGVPPALEGQGIGARLARAGLDHARAHGLRVIPECPFVCSYIQKHPEYRELTAPE